jgi:exosortase D (VPLPA-CTERM-specific)
MSQHAKPNSVSAGDPTRSSLAVLPLVICVLLLPVIFREGLVVMTDWWDEPEYQHGYIIPLVSVYLIWVKAEQLAATPTSPSMWGVVLVLLGLLGFVVGELSAIFTVVQYAFLLTLWGLVWTGIGWRGVKVIWAGLAYLVFMIPLPRFFQFNLSNILQLWSSEIGTAILQLMSVPVYLEGNVIDLGSYKLQVVEACSGLRYLFPLMSFAFFCAYIFRGSLWQKLVVFASAAPIAIFMNSFRIAVTGLLVNQYGTDQAEGFLHYFEGWIIFVACIALLFLEMTLFALLSGRKLSDAFEVEIPSVGDFRYLLGSGRVKPPVTAALVLLAAGAVGSFAIQNREETIPQHVSLASFPLTFDGWRGEDGTIEGPVLDQLRLTDYLKATYATGSDPRPVELYVAYYDSQRKGASVHSPRACLPGGGWQIEDFAQVEIAGARADGSPLEVNRAVIAKGDAQAVVYYWFMQRGRYLTNEYLVKWFIFWDALTRNRTDGAMVRVMVPAAGGEDVPAAEQQAEKFIRAAEPRLYYHIPQEALIANPDQAAGNSD